MFRNKGQSNEIIAVVDAKDKQDRQVIVPILINGIGTQNQATVQANIVKSIYGKDNFDRYIRSNATEETILYKKEPS